VYDAGPVRGRERLGSLRDEGQNLLQLQLAVRELAQGLALDELHRDEVQAVRAAHVVDGDEVRVVERGDRAGLSLEARDALRVGDELGRENLQRDPSAEARVEGEIDLAHAPRAEQFFYPVSPDLAPRERRALAPVRLARQRTRRRAHRGAREESARALLRSQEAHDFAAKLLVARARGRDEPLALAGGKLRGRVQQLVNLSPEFRVHRG
jgi:hypothetical protein